MAKDLWPCTHEMTEEQLSHELACVLWHVRDALETHHYGHAKTLCGSGMVERLLERAGWGKAGEAKERK